MATSEREARRERQAGVIPINDAARLVTAPFAEWGYSDAEAALRSRLPRNYDALRKFVADRDHLQNGDQWVGPGQGSSEKVKKLFASDDVIGEGLDNAANAFTEAFVTFQPLQPVGRGKKIPAAIQSKIDLANNIFGWWWDRRHLQELITSRIRLAAWVGWATLRPWVPGRFMRRQNGVVSFRPTGGDWRKALSYIYVSAPNPEQSAIYTHPTTQDEVSIFLDSETEVINGIETTTKRAELIYLDPERDDDEECDTILRIVYENRRRTPIEVRMRLGGRLMGNAQMKSRVLLTPSVIQNQNQLNLIVSIIAQMCIAAGFRERYLGNVHPMGTKYYLPDEESIPDVMPPGAFLERDVEHRLFMVVPEDRTLGANMTTELVGLDKTSSDGTNSTVSHETPFLHIAEPVDPTPYIATAEALRRRILRLMSQGHLANTSTAESSGEAYEQARATFAKDLKSRRVSEEGMLRDFVMGVLALAEYINGQEGYFTNFIRPEVNQYVDAGPRSPDAARIDLESYEAGLQSRETTQAVLGIEDIEGENNRLQESSAHILATIEKAVQAMGEKFDPQSIIDVLRELNLPDYIINVLKVAETTEPVENEGTPPGGPPEPGSGRQPPEVGGGRRGSPRQRPIA